MRLAEFDEHAVCGLWLQKCNQAPVRASASSLVDQSYALALQLGEFRFDVGNPVCGVVELGGRIAAISSNRRTFVQRKKQLDGRSAGLQSNRLHALIVNDLTIDFSEAERLRVKAQRRLEILDDYGNVIDVHCYHPERSAEGA